MSQDNDKKVISINTAGLKTKRDYALAYAGIGWYVLPIWWIETLPDGRRRCACGKACESPGKHPYSLHGQLNATTDITKIKYWWNTKPELNIGIFLSESKLVAVDIDPRNGGHEDFEILEDKYGKLYSEVLQFTGGGGEHRIFAAPPGLQSLPGKLAPGIDLKLNGYVLVEPSNHISGGKYDWEGYSNPLEGVMPSFLPDWIRDLAPQSGNKIDARGTFLSRHATESQIADLRSALTVIDPDDRNTWVKVGTALKTLGAAGWNLWLEYSQRSPKFKLYDQRRVWYSLKPHSLNYETVFFLAQQAGWNNMPSIPIQVIDLKPYQKPAGYPSINRLPGILGEIEDYYNATAYIPQPQFAQQASLAIASTFIGRRFKTTYDHYSSMYFACIAPSSCGKEHVKTVATDIFNACEKDFLSGDGYTSSGGVISALKERPCHLSVIDEFGLYLEHANNKNNPNGRDANTMLMQATTRAKSELRSKNYSTKGVSNNKSVCDVILRPAISLVGLTTPVRFYKNLTHEMISDGFFGRFLVVNSKMPRVAPRIVRPVAVPQSIIDWSAALDSRINDKMNAFANYAMIAEQCVIDVDDDAIDLLNQFSAEMVELMNKLEPEGLDALVGRSAELAGRGSFIIALSGDAFASQVNGDHAETAIQYVRQITLDSIDDIRSNLIGSAYQQAKKEVLESIRSAKEGVTERDMNRKQPYNKYKDKELSEILQSLVKAEHIALVNTREGKPGKPRMAFFALNCQIDIELT